ncbi:hypothetical protein CCHR01_02515 [Colletotrichum chrysophilum]|uniref:Uncharacterized protein n=1 Tax=Colletotrichum chrysophilum TaxID=1836956 RepID=A0AAD9EN97_9PEZI|nr:hypothetical protein CCHR01_02515 [Colletotrichum chrysophilum]
MPREKDESDSNRKKSRDGHQKGYQGQTDPIDADRTVDMTERNDTTDESSPIAPYTGNKK